MLDNAVKRMSWAFLSMELLYPIYFMLGTIHPLQNNTKPITQESLKRVTVDGRVAITSLRYLNKATTGIMEALRQQVLIAETS